jgi:hypothetical protein
MLARHKPLHIRWTAAIWSFQFGITVPKKVIGQFGLPASIVISKAVSESKNSAFAWKRNWNSPTIRAFGMPDTTRRVRGFIMRNSLNHQVAGEDQEVSSVLGRKPVRSESQIVEQLPCADGTVAVLSMPPARLPGYGIVGKPKDEGQTRIALEKHCSVAELSKQWGFSENTIRRLFRKEPGVIKIVHQETRHKRGYTSMRIPERIAQRVHRRLQGLA